MDMPCSLRALASPDTTSASRLASLGSGLQESARSVRQRMQGISQDAAFLEIKSAPAAEDDLAAAERLHRAELVRELGVSSSLVRWPNNQSL